MAKPTRAEQTKTRVLDAALRLYARNGPGGLSVHEVVTESGVSLGSIYHHFGSMDGLCAALYARCMGQLLDAIGDALVQVRGARGAVRALVETYVRHAEQNRHAALFIHASSYASFLPAHAQLVAAEKLPRLERIRAQFRRHVEAGRIVPLPEPLLEVMLIGPVAEAVRRALAGAPDIDLGQVARVLPERVYRAVALEPSARRAAKPHEAV
jgi:AcrR family transcriptional regulator